ncbi:Uu.00g128090.m01.CDS01 [Anthostomella pinea]|uniref:alpha-1,2-Mannosidase n=1 Tax=Anthostomella pinea TaxID=933095 RepID=A0AAI8YHU8_9PEZI|nr:Uu.00g128090.m01.CDS01 [Anthostomella pinea]
MVRYTWAFAALGCVSPVVSALTYESHPERLDAVAEAFQRAWNGYYTYAFPNDSLAPITKTSYNDRNGWGASAVDAISTALVMGNKKVVNEIVDHITTINFNMTSPDDTSVSLFETTIRYLAGMLSAYDFLSGPLSDLLDDPASLDTILKQAVSLADTLSVAFTTSSGVPINDLIYNGPEGPVPDRTETTNGIATIGTLVLEWTRLSDLTGDTKYAELTQTAEDYLLNVRNPGVGEPYPGLIGTDVNVTNGLFVDSSGGWNGGTDSFYEYLIKMYLYDTARFAEYKDRWSLAVDSSIKYLASHPSSRPDLTFLAAYEGAGPANLSFFSEHLACFDGGNIILGGLTLNNQGYIDFGLELVAACHDTYTATVTGIGPEIFQWQDSKLAPNATNNAAPPANQSSFYETAGFWITDPVYDLRPEVIESFYYAYRATGDSKYQDWAWEAFLHINATCSAGVGFSSVMDVNAPGGGGFYNQQESFWFAEVLKYSYLIQAEEAPWQVSAAHDNEWVFNTEAHPFRVAGTPV